SSVAARDAQTQETAAPANATSANQPVDDDEVVVRTYWVQVPFISRAAPGDKSTQAAQSADGQAAEMNLVPDDRYLDGLVKAIPGLVRPEDWLQNGGLGTVFALPADASGKGRLLVRQTGKAHQELQQFLKQLEADTAAS